MLRDTIAATLADLESRSLDDAADRAAVTDAIIAAIRETAESASARRVFGGVCRADRFALAAGHGARLGVAVDAAWLLACEAEPTPPDWMDPTVEVG